MNWKALAILGSLLAAGCGDPMYHKPDIHVDSRVSNINEQDEVEITIKYKGNQATPVTAEVNGQTVIP